MTRKSVAFSTLLSFAIAFSFSISVSRAQDTTSVTGEMLVHYINVGQADAILIECPTREHFMLIDAGDTRYPGSSRMFKAAMQSLVPASDKTIDVVVASHPHADHIGSMKWVLNNFKVLRYLDNGQANETAMYQNLMEVVNGQTHSGTLKYGAAEVVPKDFVDFCPANNVNAEVVFVAGMFDDCDNPNNCSVVMRIDYGKTSFLFPGDAELEEEKVLLADPKIRRKLNVDVLKAAHHGSNTSSSMDFVKAVTPKFVVVSVGERDIGTNVGYKHPQVNSIKSFNSAIKKKKYREKEVEVYDKDTKQWTMMRVKEGIFLTKIDQDITLVSNGKSIRKSN